MEQQQKERLVGAIVLVIVAVVFIPMILNDTTVSEKTISETNIPPKPESQFSSKIIPITTDDSVVKKANQQEIDTTGEVFIPTDPTSQGSAISNVDSVNDDTVSTEEDINENIGLNAWVVQLGSFSSNENAHALKQELRDAGFPAFVEPHQQDGNTVFRVRVGPDIKRSDAIEMQKRIKQVLNEEGIVVSYP